MPNLFGLVFAAVGNQTVVAVLVSMAVMVWAAFRKESFPMAVAAGMLVSYHGLIHDATILIIPALLFAEWAVAQRCGFWKGIWPSAAVFAYPTIAVSAMLPYCLLALPVLGFLGFSSEPVENRRVRQEQHSGSETQSGVT